MKLYKQVWRRCWWHDTTVYTTGFVVYDILVLNVTIHWPILPVTLLCIMVMQQLCIDSSEITHVPWDVSASGYTFKISNGIMCQYAENIVRPCELLCCEAFWWSASICICVRDKMHYSDVTSAPWLFKLKANMLNTFVRLTTKKRPKLRITGFLWGIHWSSMDPFSKNQ